MFHEILAQTNWEGVGVAVSMVLATATAGYVIQDKSKTKKRQASDAAEQTRADVVIKELCDSKHEALERLLEARKSYFDTRFGDLKETVETGFDRIEKSLNGRKA